MNDQIISQFIDDELSLDDKIAFVETVHGSAPFREETVALLRQEKRLRSDPVERVPERALKTGRRRFRFLRPCLWAAGTAAAAALVLILFPFMPDRNVETPYRFVFFSPDAGRVEITGSFTDWRAVPMKKLGDSGYWEYNLSLPRGEYRFAYLLNGGERLPDPTIPTREGDDFGSENTVLSIGGRTT